MLKDLFDTFGDEMDYEEQRLSDFTAGEREIHERYRLQKELLFLDIEQERRKVAAESSEVDRLIEERVEEIKRLKRAEACYGHLEVKCKHLTETLESDFGLFRRKVTARTPLYELPLSCPAEVMGIGYNTHKDRFIPDDPDHQLRPLEESVLKGFAEWFDANASLVGCEEDTGRRYARLSLSRELSNFISPDGVDLYMVSTGDDSLEVSSCISYPLKEATGMHSQCPAGKGPSSGTEAGHGDGGVK